MACQLPEAISKIEEILSKNGEGIASAMLSGVQINMLNEAKNNLQSAIEIRIARMQNNTNDTVDTDKEYKEETDKLELLEEKIKQLENKINNKSVVNTTINNTNNGIINNIKIVALGHEDISKLSSKKINMIMNSGYTALYKLIEEVNLNPKYPENNNIRVTNINSRYCDVFDYNSNKFIKKPKNQVLDDIIDSRTFNLDTLHTEYGIEGNTRHQCVRIFLDDIKRCADEKDTNVELKKEYKDICEKIILLIYNNQSFLEK